MLLIIYLMSLTHITENGMYNITNEVYLETQEQVLQVVRPLSNSMSKKKTTICQKEDLWQQQQQQQQPGQ